MSKRKKPNAAPKTAEDERDSVTTRVAVAPDVLEAALRGAGHPAVADEPRPALDTDQDTPHSEAPLSESIDVSIDLESAQLPAAAAGHSDAQLTEELPTFDPETTVNLGGDLLPVRDDLDGPTIAAPGDALAEVDRLLIQRKHLRGLLESLVFASDGPIKANELGKLAHAPLKHVKELLIELQQDYSTRGIHLDEVAGGWVFRTSPQYAPFVRDLTKQKPVRLTRAQVETLAIIAYRQPITRPEVDDVRGVDTGPVLKLLLERDLVRILGKRDEPGRPLIYGTTGNFLEFFGLKSLKDLPTLREFTELSDESRDVFEEELGESPEDAARHAAEAEARAAASEGGEQARGEHEEIQDQDRDALEGQHTPHESMRVPVGEHALDDPGEDDLEPLSDRGEDDVDHEEREEQAPHAADEDGPTITTESPGEEER